MARGRKWSPSTGYGHSKMDAMLHSDSMRVLSLRIIELEKPLEEIHDHKAIDDSALYVLTEGERIVYARGSTVTRTRLIGRYRVFGPVRYTLPADANAIEDKGVSHVR